MSGTTPLTNTSYALLPDSPDISNAGKPGFENLEKFAIPRFANVSARNLAFQAVTPAKGQTIWIDGEGYQVYSGTAWEEGYYHFARPYGKVFYQADPDTAETGSNWGAGAPLQLADGIPVVAGRDYKVTWANQFGALDPDSQPTLEAFLAIDGVQISPTIHEICPLFQNQTSHPLIGHYQATASGDKTLVILGRVAFTFVSVSLNGFILVEDIGPTIG